MPALKGEIADRLKWIGFAGGLSTFLAFLWTYLDLTRLEFLQTLGLFGIVALLIVVWTGFEHMSRRLDDLE